MVSRRTFLKRGLVASALLLGGASVAYVMWRNPVHDRETVLRALTRGLLAGALADDPQRDESIERCVRDVGTAIARLPLADQSDLTRLFALLAMAPTRAALAGVTGSWANTTTAQVNAFLESWHFHRYAMMRSAYHGLRDLVLSAWYGNPASWVATGYPGPPKI